MKFSLPCKLFAAIGLSAVSGCGTYVPAMEELWDNHGDKNNNISPPLESDISSRVYCDIKNAVLDEYPGISKIPDEKGANPKQLTFLDYGIQVALTLTVDETSTLAPGLTFNTPMVPSTTFFPNKVTVVSPQSYAFSLGANLSAHATRIDKFNFFYTVAGLIGEKPCEEGAFREGSSFLIQSGDLRISEWLRNAIQHIPLLRTVDHKAGQVSATTPPAASPPKIPTAEILTYEVKFDVISSGNITPTWHLVRETANPTGSFFWPIETDSTM